MSNSISIAAELSAAERVDLAWAQGELRFYVDLMRDAIQAGEVRAVPFIDLLDQVAESATRAARRIENGGE